MRYYELFEAPLNDISFHGDVDNAGSYNATDLKVFNNPKWIKKVITHLGKLPQKINVFLYNAPEGKYIGRDKHGSIINTKSINSYFDGAVPNSKISELESLVGIKIPRDADAINFLMFDNEGSDQVALTPWILIHRFAHALVDGNGPQALLFSECMNFARPVINQYMFEKYGVTISNKIFKFRSAREKLITRRSGEFAIELITQYIVQGSITINKPVLTNFAKDIRILYEVPVDDEIMYSSLVDAVRHSYGESEALKLFDSNVKSKGGGNNFGTIHAYFIKNYSKFYEVFMGYKALQKWLTTVDKELDLLNNMCAETIDNAIGQTLVISGN